VTSQKRLGCDVTVGPHHQELGVSMAAPACPVAMAAKPVNGRSWRKVPLLCVQAFSNKCGLGKMEIGTATEHV
jgi:hypothetical protein